MDKHKLNSDNEDFLNGFLTMLEIANSHKLGLVMGIDMRDDLLKRLPDYKLTQKSGWGTLDTSGLYFGG